MDKELDIGELNRLYKEGDELDSELFAEMRSNILLVSGNHYTKRTSQLFSQIRQSAKATDSQKLRITQNHIHKISKHYVHSILNKAPGVTVSPQNDLEMKDRKAAELNQAVWKDMQSRYKLKERKREWAQQFVDVGEVCCFIYYDPDKGAVKGYENLVDQQGNPVFGESGMPAVDETKPVMDGAFEYKTMYGWNVLRTGAAREMRTAPVIMLREMVDIDELRKTYAGDEKKISYLGEGDGEPFVVFDATKQRYESTDEVLLRYHFFRPSRRFPNGYFTVSTELGILEENELPFGIWPIAWKGFDAHPSNPRGYSIIKVARPYQAEINRASSQMAMHQITVGDDKIIYQSGTKLASGALLPGVRGLTYQGAPPQILPGRDGGQFIPYIEKKIQEMYTACDMGEVGVDNETNQLDPFSLLYRAASQAQKNASYTEKFEEFLADVCMISLELAKQYLPDDAVIMAVGRSEQINLPEFRATTPLSYQIKIEPQVDSAETKLGRQMTLTHVLQYVGGQMDPKQIGLVLKEMPFLNNNALFKNMSMDYDNAENDMLTMERGKLPSLSPYADNKVYVDRLTNRMKMSDFTTLPPRVQQAYGLYLKAHESEIARKAEELQKAQAGFIPTGGALITCSMHLPDPKNPGKTKQVRLPYQAIDFLVQKLEQQGQGLEQLENMNQGAMADIAGEMVPQGGGQMPQPGPQMIPHMDAGAPPPHQGLNIPR